MDIDILIEVHPVSISVLAQLFYRKINKYDLE